MCWAVLLFSFIPPGSPICAEGNLSNAREAERPDGKAENAFGRSDFSIVISLTREDCLQAALASCWGNDDNCFCRLDAAATTMAALSALQIYSQGHNVCQTFRGERSVCHTYSHHIRSPSNFSEIVTAKVCLDKTFFIRRLTSQIVTWTEDCFLNVSLVCHRHLKLTVLGKARFVKKGRYCAAS